MYRRSFTRLLNNSSLIFAKNSSALCNVQKHNLNPITKTPPTSLLNKFIKPSSGKHFQYIKNAGYDETFSILAKAYKEYGRVQAHSLFSILGQRNVDYFSNDQSLLLLQCCGQALVDKAPSARSTLCDQVWAKLNDSETLLELQHYNKYLEICVENKTKLDYLNFISNMKNCEPSKETYYLLLHCACQLGDVAQSINIISEMKKKHIPIDEKVFNMLILGNATNGGLEDALAVLKSMQITRITPSPLTYSLLLQGVAEHSDYTEFLKALQMHPGEMDEQEFLKLILILGLKGNHVWSKEVLKKFNFYTISKEGLRHLNLLCIHLIHMKQWEAAFYYYKKLAFPHNSQEQLGHTVALFAEILSTGVPTQKVVELIKDLCTNDHIYVIQRLTEVALRKGLINAAWDLFLELPHLRPHYFWPILLQAAIEQRENGIFSVITKMIKLGIKPDIDTLELYIIPHCDASDPKNLLIRLKHLGFSYKELLTPILSHLLKTGQLLAAQKLCSISDNIALDSERLIQPLFRAWLNIKDSTSTVILLKHMCDEKENDHILGKFLLRIFKACKTPADYNHFLELVKALHDNKMMVPTISADAIFYYLNNLNHRTLKKTIQAAIESITDNTINKVYTMIPHPRNMQVNDLENHLIELQNKNMETRGVLRKLIQHYCRSGNETKAFELRQQFLDAGYEESAGMKSVLFYAYVNKGNETDAMEIYKEIKFQHPEFVLDDFKIIDFATLLVEKNKYETAIKLLSETQALKGGPEIVRNCWRLLSSANSEKEIQHLYDLLIEKCYCVPSNIILGPFIKIHIKSGNLEKAVQVYENIANKYNCTPLQVELLCAIVKTENEELLEIMLSITSKVYGTEATKVSLISALSQAGLNKSLRKYLLEMQNIPTKEIAKLCDRWLQCKDVLALETLTKAVYNFPPKIFDETIVYNYLMQMHGINNDCESAVKFYRQLLDLNVKVPASLTHELLKMVSRCNYIVSEDLFKEKIRS